MYEITAKIMIKNSSKIRYFNNPRKMYQSNLNICFNLKIWHLNFKRTRHKDYNYYRLIKFKITGLKNGLFGF